MLFTGLLAVLTIGFPNDDPPVRISESEVVNLPLRWDAGWYLDIAVHGYRWSPAAEGQQNVAFFPAFPTLMSLGAALVNAGNEPEGLGARLSYERYYVWHLAAGLVVALAAFLWALAYLYRLAREDLDDRSATSAIVLLCAFPFAVFYGAPYSESLFLLATVAAFFHVRRGEWAVTCAWGALAGLTRPNGFVLCVPLALLALGGRARSPRAWLAVAAPLGGLAAFSLYLLAYTGNPLAWLDAHAAWGRSAADLDMLLAFPLEFRSGETLYNRTVGDPLLWLDGGAAILALALVVPVTRRLGWAYGSWVVANLALAIGSGGLLSVGRVVSTLFPLFVYLGVRLTPRAVRIGGGGVRLAAGNGGGAVLYVAAVHLAPGQRRLPAQTSGRRPARQRSAGVALRFGVPGGAAGRFGAPGTAAGCGVGAPGTAAGAFGVPVATAGRLGTSVAAAGRKRRPGVPQLGPGGEGNLLGGQLARLRRRGP